MTQTAGTPTFADPANAALFALGLAVEKTAQIRGDSDSVACLAGALLGAALGTAAMPTEWLDTLPQSGEVADLADRLLGLVS